MACIVCDSTSENIKFIYSGTEFFECLSCGLIRTKPFPSAEEIEKHYKKMLSIGNYSTSLKNMDVLVELYKSYVVILREQIGNLEGKKILDVGCFTGDFLDLALQEGAETYGIELQKEASEIANKKHGNRIINSPINEAQFEKNFDAITMFGLIEHVTNPEILIKGASKCLDKGNVLIIQTPNSNSFWSKILGKYWPPYAPVEHIHYFSTKNITPFLDKYGFSVITVKPHIKMLNIEYVYNMLKNFGPEFHTLFKPIYRILPAFVKKMKLPFYGGEMLIVAKKK
jgi:SAM-dependent methyltransferase